MRCECLILAAGLGKRMKSMLPKVLHPVGGRPLLAWALEACRGATGIEPALVVAPGMDEILRKAGLGKRFVVQKERLGTAHAVMQAADELRGQGDLLLVVNGDMPLLEAATLRRLIEAQEAHAGAFTLLTVHGDEARGFGRLQRDERGQVIAIVEEADATSEQLALREFNVGAYCFRSEWLWESLAKLEVSAQGEYYLTDLVALAVKEERSVATVEVADPDEAIGVNTREHLAQVEAVLRGRVNRKWMLAGVTLQDPATTYIGPQVEIGQDSVILSGTHLEGGTVIGAQCQLGPNTIVCASRIGDRCRVSASVLEEATLEDDVDVGPFAHLRKGAHLCRGVHMGNFGEVKNSIVGAGAKLGHFSYLGDATIGEGVNIGAGTITCNYDGERKFHTEIEEGAFIGSDTMLVAPVRIGRGARTGAGAVVTKDVPPWSVAVGIPARVIRKLKESDD
jgi:bifunctional UDP-N-acetylglucosamine pyrophosphorylase/glucosamine-1-phosphate N-acetyltransferase